MKDRWGIDFKSGTFSKQAIDADLDEDIFLTELEG